MLTERGRVVSGPVPDFEPIPAEIEAQKARIKAENLAALREKPGRRTPDGHPTGRYVGNGRGRPNRTGKC